MNYKTVNNASFKKLNSVDFLLNTLNLKNPNYKSYNNMVLNLLKLLLDNTIKAIPPLDERTT